MVKRKVSGQDVEEEVLTTIQVAVGMVLASKPGGRIDVSRDRECAVNVLASLEEEGFKVVKNANRT